MYFFSTVRLHTISFSLYRLCLYMPDVRIYVSLSNISNVEMLLDFTSVETILGQLGANISPDRSSLMPQVLIGNLLCKPFVVCHKSWEKLYELQHINLLSLYLPKEDGVSPDAEYITQQSIFSIFLQ